MSQVGQKKVDTISEQEVCDYLSQHPDFLERQPGVLQALQLPAATDASTSLLQKQVATLRADNQKLRDALAAAEHVATLNESASAKVGKLVDCLLASSDLEQLFQSLYQALNEDFAIPSSTVRIFPDRGADIDNVSKQGQKLRVLFPEAQMLKKAQCGLLGQEQVEFLFPGEAASRLRSFALVPLGSGNWHGMLCMGCEDKFRFTKNHDTQLLDHIGHVLTALLQPWLAARNKTGTA